MFFIIMFLLSGVFTFLVTKYGFKLSMVDRPNKRSSHSIPIPRGGGIGVCLTVVLFGLLFSKYRTALVLFGFVGFLGLLEDIYTLSEHLRFVVLSIVAVFVVISFSGFTLFTVTNIPVLLFCVLFMVGTACIYNFMDGINGMAGLSAIVSFSLIGIYSYMSKEYEVTSISAALCMGTLGFLPFNFPRAKVFMGDVGSLFLGFVFASIVLGMSKDLSSFICLSMFLCTFYADATITMLYRLKRGENLIKAHRNHLYQRLSNELGYPHWKVSVLYALIQTFIGVISLITYKMGLNWQILLLLLFLLAFVFLYGILDRKIVGRSTC